jgi:EAL domain-containing protein (putative c-di-GMP-specific phosphodiesterase class I)
VNEISTRRESLLEALVRESVGLRKLRFVGRSPDAEETFELIPLPFADDADADPYQTAAGCGLAGKFDRFVFQQALQELGDRVMRGRMGRLIFRQSTAVLEDADYLEFVKSELRRRQIVGTGLVVDFDLPSLAVDFTRAKTLIGELTELGLKVTLSSFACNETSYKVLTYLTADAVRPHHSLLGAEKDRIQHIVRQLQSLHAEIILPRVMRQAQIAAPWLELADYVQAEYED